MKVKSAWLRSIHKWVGLVIGLQFLLWAVSGLAMALLDMEEVAGGARAEAAAGQLPATGAWETVVAQLGREPVEALSIRQLPAGPVYAVTTSRGVRLFDAASGEQRIIGAPVAAAIASAAHSANAAPRTVTKMAETTLAVREHSLPIWRVGFADAAGSVYYVSGTTGELLERRNDSWRWWDFFWMLHNMDYWERTSFNHPLIVVVTFATLWLSITGVWLLFRCFHRRDFAWLRPRRS